MTTLTLPRHAPKEVPMPLEWFRMDCNIGTHDKILALLEHREGAKAFVAYVCGIGYAAGHGTDGHVPRHALRVIHATPRLAVLLVDFGLWDVHTSNGWLIHNYAERQELAFVTEQRAADRQLRSRKGNCVRHHGPDCGCWRKGGTP